VTNRRRCELSEQNYLNSIFFVGQNSHHNLTTTSVSINSSGWLLPTKLRRIRTFQNALAGFLSKEQLAQLFMAVFLVYLPTLDTKNVGFGNGNFPKLLINLYLSSALWLQKHFRVNHGILFVTGMSKKKNKK